MGAFFILSSAVVWSTAPLIIELTAQSSDPFDYNFLYQAVNVVIMVVFLAITKHKLFDPSLSSHPEAESSLWKEASNPAVLWPLMLTVIGSFNYALFIWSASFVETAVSSVIFELWPIVLIYLLATCRTGTGRKENPLTKPHLAKEQICLSVLAAVGLLSGCPP